MLERLEPYLKFIEVAAMIFLGICTLILSWVALGVSNKANEISDDNIKAAGKAASAAYELQADVSRRALLPLFDFRYSFGSEGRLRLKNVGPGVAGFATAGPCVP